MSPERKWLVLEWQSVSVVDALCATKEARARPLVSMQFAKIKTLFSAASLLLPPIASTASVLPDDEKRASEGHKACRNGAPAYDAEFLHADVSTGDNKRACLIVTTSSGRTV